MGATSVSHVHHRPRGHDYLCLTDVDYRDRVDPQDVLEVLTHMVAAVIILSDTPTAAAGLEEVNANFFNTGTTLFGLGNPGFSNAGCLITTPFSFAGNTPANCIANNRRLSDVTVGFWQNVYKGDYGRVAVGAQYEYIKREVFAGVDGASSTDNNIVLTSLRYYPF